MVWGKDSELQRLVRGESGALRPSAPERLLLKFALDTFGGQLSQVLLAGLGKERGGRRWNFTITYAGGGAAHTRRLQAITYEPESGQSFLPRRRHPLVLLALLQLLLHSRQESKTTLIYDQKEILDILGWGDSEETRREIDEAVERYSFLTYMWEAGKTELAGHNISSYKARECIISEYEIDDTEVGSAGQVERVFNRVVFQENFIDGLLRRLLFGIEWDSVSLIELASEPVWQ